MDLLKKTPTTKRGGRTYPKARTLYRSRAPGAKGKNAGRKAGRPKAVNQGGEISPKNPEMRIRKQCLCFDNWIVMIFDRFKDISREFSDVDGRATVRPMKLSYLWWILSGGALSLLPPEKPSVSVRAMGLSDWLRGPVVLGEIVDGILAKKRFIAYVSES
ncbi:hypothetical protein TNCV_64901 [Trichonephila clavipes]|nr:hypothetical protein TNCV_64901 [Trichonephila clavipes]